MKNKLYCLFALLILAAPIQADNNPDTEESTPKSSLLEVLPGTWNYVSSSTTRDGVFEPIEPTKIYWTLNSDGTGTYYRKINQFNAARIQEGLRWSVKGKTLTMDGDIHYTIVDWDTSRMIWQNPGKTTFLRVERQK